MAGLLARLKASFFAKTAHSEEPSSAATTGPSKTVEELPGISIASARSSFYRGLFGRPISFDQASVPEKLIIDVVTQAMSDRERRIKSLPRLPSVIPKLLQSLRDANSSSKDFVNIINKDPALTAGVLKLANSVYYNPQGNHISNIELAVVKLGVDGLRSVLSAAVLQPVIECKSPYFSDFGHKLWEHSLACAVACELIARRRQLEPFKAYLLGLVHDMGKITLFTELSNQFKQQSNSSQRIEPSYASFAPLMESLSPALSHTIAEDWQLPEEIAGALEEQIHATPGSTLSPYAFLLFQANIACELYFGFTQADEADQEILSEAASNALETMGLPQNLFERIDSVLSEQ